MSYAKTNIVPGSEESCIKNIGHLAKCIEDMSMEEYAIWIVRGTIPPGMQEAADKDFHITPEQRKELDAAECTT